MCKRISGLSDEAIRKSCHVCLWRRLHQGNGIYEQITESLTKAGKNVIPFSDICENPTYEKVLEGAKLAKENEIDFILAVGGGSVMDCCKQSVYPISIQNRCRTFWIPVK